MKTFFSELKERNVVRVGAVYLGTAWLITHVGTILGENFEFPHWVMRSVIVFLALGFPVALGFAWIYEATPEGLKRTTEVPPGQSTTQATGRKLDRLIIAVLGLVVAALLADRFLLHESLPQRLAMPWGSEATVYGTVIVIGIIALLAATLVFMRAGSKRRAMDAATPASATALPSSAAAAQADKRISRAVLPFANMSSDAEQEYFSDGLSEELMNKLAQVKRLRVAARTSCFAFKGQNEDVKAVGEKLGVGHVLEGSVRKAGNRLRITAQLIDCADGAHLWSNTFDRELDDVFAIQENVAHAVAEALGVTLGIGETRAPGGTTNLEAYDLYLRARALQATNSPPEVMRSIDIYRKSVALDPDFAMAWAGLGSALGTSLIFSPETVAAARAEMEAAIARAAELAPGLPEIHASQVFQRLANYDWAGAEKLLAARAGTAGDTQGVFVVLLGTLGRVEESIRYGTTLRQDDPLSLGTSFNLQFAFDCAGRFDEAEAEYERSKDLPGTRGTLEWRAITRMMALKDKTRLKQRFADYVAHGLSWMKFDSQLVNVLDKPAEALKLVRAAFDDPAYQDAARMGALAHWAVYFGDRDLAFKALRRDCVEMHGLTVHEIWHPIFAELRKDPRFKDILRGMGLVDHWRKTGNWGDFARPLGKDDFEIIR